jgi:hypothetical protein
MFNPLKKTNVDLAFFLGAVMAVTASDGLDKAIF